MCPFFGVGSDVMTSLLVKKNQRRAFSAAEDLKLTSLVQIHGQDRWETVSQYMEGRSARACRERWRLFLSPGITNGPWSHKEDALLIKLFNEHGPKWKTLSKYFNGRSECNVKNRWTRHLKQMLSSENNNSELYHEPEKSPTSIPTPQVSSQKDPAPKKEGEPLSIIPMNNNDFVFDFNEPDIFDTVEFSEFIW